MAIKTLNFGENDFLKSIADIKSALTKGMTIIGCNKQNGELIAEAVYAADTNSGISGKDIICTYWPLVGSMSLEFKTARTTNDLTIEATEIKRHHKYVFVDSNRNLDIESPIISYGLTRTKIREMLSKPKTIYFQK